jgi:hypothetical protein
VEAFPELRHAADEASNDYRDRLLSANCGRIALHFIAAIAGCLADNRVAIRDQLSRRRARRTRTTEKHAFAALPSQFISPPDRSR